MRGGSAIAGIALSALAAAAFAWIQGATPHLVDRDGYFHARYTNLLPERGLARRFEWAQESVLRERFSDKELLFHILLAPFCRDEASMVPRTKVAVVIIDVAIVASFYAILRAQGIRAAPLFALALLAAGNHFVFRLAMARPHLLSVLLAIAGAHAILARRRALVAGIGFVYAWTYAAPYLLIALALADRAARALHASPPETDRGGSLLAAAGGVAAGLVLHPYFPNDLHALLVQSGLGLGRAWGLGPGAALGPIRLGDEFGPITTRSLLLTSTGALAALAGGIAAGLAGRARPSARTLSLAFMAGGTLFLFLLSAKFVEYFAPLAILFAGSAVGDALGERPWREVLAGPFRRLAAGAAIAAVALLAWRSVAEARRGAALTPPPSLEGCARWLRANAPPGETVLHLSWADFAVLFHFDPEHRYLVSFDPMYMWAHDPGKARLLEDVRAGRRPLDPAELRRAFGGRWLAIPKERPRHVEAALDAGLEAAYEDAGGVVFRIEDR